MSNMKNLFVILVGVIFILGFTSCEESADDSLAVGGHSNVHISLGGTIWIGNSDYQSIQLIFSDDASSITVTETDDSGHIGGFKCNVIYNHPYIALIFSGEYGGSAFINDAGTEIYLEDHPILYKQ